MSTLPRLRSDYMPPIITTNVQYESLIMKDLQHITQEYKIILEPVKIGTAAAILTAALLCDEDEVMLILPSDHFIGNLDNFYTSIDKASEIACKTNAIVTFGVKPCKFNSEYGYIDALYDSDKKYHIVQRFLEKPAYELSNDHYWNSGIFVFKAKRYIDEVKKFAPNLYKLCYNSVKHFIPQEKFLYLKQQDFEGIESISIDHLIMEKVKNIAMIEANFNWMDIGTWNAVLELNKRKNCFFLRSTLHEDKGCFLGNMKQLSEVIELRKRSISSQSLMSFINKVKNMAVIKKEIRPWGFFDVILTGENFLVKRLFIDPLSCTSKQFHNHRDEYHIVLSGIGHITLDEKIHTVVQNHLIEIPRNVAHRIENKNTDFPLEIIEFQIGEHLSDSDIVRLDDIYGRTA
ncbi:MAG TPA: mannose-1-phosphate guanyltransferase [Wolbachia sp.]|uniref:sugar phosphate nucleotidyltransferase n=1 Tax=Wolbachia endosymbiont of Pentalonia nigronervosa TaxID=1301914 RepID=UPI000ED1D7E4|nr:sugar phosphate nucleotidyltransferase [Wolbachia endosymbiont of Pentalonia nigronervosa]MBD0391410.1 cupin domain-containing protein [Wolbachia endosymbiont of Pentalonia nigronervosa]HCE59457.1 mannose-1-phosphate guanyltransferase [Wolbachia sp.]